MRIAPFAILFLGTFCSSVFTTAQINTPDVSVDKLMTPKERVETGISSLTTAQRAALNRWLTIYALQTRVKVLEGCTKSSAALENRTAPRAGERVTSEYMSTGSGHWIQENGNGKIITLEDGSIWQVSDFDQIDTALWLPVTDITVIRNPSGIGSFKYTLVNTEDGEKASAKYLGSH